MPRPIVHHAARAQLAREGKRLYAASMSLRSTSQDGLHRCLPYMSFRKRVPNAGTKIRLISTSDAPLLSGTILWQLTDRRRNRPPTPAYYERQ